MRWVSPLEDHKCREYKDGAFLRALGRSQDAPALSKFWPSGGPVWDGLAVVKQLTAGRDAIILVEAKSYPSEVRGGGCKATPKPRLKIETALDATAAWLAVRRPASWTGALYQSANRIAHVYFLREKLGLEAYMVNVCFVGDPRMPTTEETWRQAKQAFRSDLGIADVAVPWLIDVTLPAANREELVHPGE
jgi:hypothetical protein